MTNSLAFVGDIHGNVAALEGLWSALSQLGPPHVVFLGDYINKGAHSAEVVDMLIGQQQSGRATLLAGNHEHSLLAAVDDRDLSAYLKMGGAPTIRSYVGGPVGPDVLVDFRRSLPVQHLEAIRRMPASFETEHVLARHHPMDLQTTKYVISAHVPMGPEPRITHRGAQIDTGCGEVLGRLTALLWPSLEYVQVDNDGELTGR